MIRIDNDFKLFCIGGKQIYNQFIPLCKKVWVTQLKKDYCCDLFMNNLLDKFNGPTIIEEDEELKIMVYENKNVWIL